MKITDSLCNNFCFKLTFLFLFALNFRFNCLKKEENISSFAKAISQYNDDIWLPCFGIQSHTQTCLKSLDVYEGLNPRLLVANPAHFRLVWDFWRERKFGTEPLSTGAYFQTHVVLFSLLSFCLHLCHWPN